MHKYIYTYIYTLTHNIYIERGNLFVGGLELVGDGGVHGLLLDRPELSLFLSLYIYMYSTHSHKHERHTVCVYICVCVCL